LCGTGKPIGFVCAFSERAGHFSPADADLLAALASQTAAGLSMIAVLEQHHQKEREQVRFVQVATHELRSPTAGALSLLRTLMRGLAGELNDRQQDILCRVDARLNNLMSLVDDLLSLAAIQSSGGDESRQRILVQPLLEQLIEGIRPEAEARGVGVTLEAPTRALAIQATEEALGRIFGNLISNGVKYTPAGGRITVVARPAGDMVEVRVADSGIGIPAADLPHIWEEFFRAANARQAGVVGTGLGLSIVRQLVESLHGEVIAESVEGQGATFTVRLPADARDRLPRPAERSTVEAVP
jgi:two-component system phosphate regulon sensor histidine kinase PhoR